MAKSLCGFLEKTQFSSVGLLKVFPGKGGFGRAGGDDSHVQQDKPVEVGRDRGKVVVHYKAGFSLLTEASKERDDRFLGCGIDGGERFVHEIQLGVLHEGASEKDSLLLPAGKLADLAIGKMTNPDLGQAVMRLFGLLPGDPAKPPESPIGTHRHNIESAHREIPVDAFSLRDIGDEVTLFLVGFPIDSDFPGGPRDEIETGFDESALSGPIGAYDSDELSFGDVEVDVPEHRFAMIGDGEVVDREGDVLWVGG
jgi:hypothetical protein